jgi:hypothetical protein
MLLFLAQLLVTVLLMQLLVTYGYTTELFGQM